MSWVEIVMCKKFVLYCGEQRANYDDKIYSENHIKIKKTDNNILYGFTGNVGDIRSLFEPFIEMNEAFEIFIKKEAETHTYCTVRNILIDRFNQLLHEANKKEMNILSAISGWNGNSFETTKFIISKDANTKNEYQIMVAERNGLDTVFLGKDIRHHENFMQLFMKAPKATIFNFKNAYMNALEIGVKFDNTINTNCKFELIKESNFSTI